MKVQEQGTTTQSTSSRTSDSSGKLNLLEGPISATFWRFSMPLWFGFLANVLYTWVDLYFVSKLGESATAALGWGEQVMFILFSIGSGFLTATGIVVARRIGERNTKGAVHAAQQALSGFTAVSVSLSLLLLLLLPTIIAATSLSPEASELAYNYLAIVALGLPFNFMVIQISNIIRSAGNSMFSMWILLFTTILNGGLDPFLIYGWGPFPELGIEGAAVATITAQVLGAIVSILTLASGRAGFRVPIRFPSPDVAVLLNIARLGVSSTLQMMSVSVTRAGLLKLVTAYFGTEMAAAYIIGLRLDFFIFMPVFAGALALQIITSQNLGAGSVKRVFAFFRNSVTQLSIVIAGLGFVAWFFRVEFAAAFANSEFVKDQVVNYVDFAVFGYVFFTIGVVCTRLIAGAGATFRSMLIIAVSLMGIQLPLAFVLASNSGWGIDGVWIASVAGYAIFMVIALFNVQGKKWLRARV